jgi:transposase
MPKFDVRSLPIAPEEVQQALALEQDPMLRKRLLALQALFHGQSQEEAAAAAGATPGSLRLWLRLVRQGGLSTLLQHRKGKHPRALPAREIGVTSRQIDRLLAEEDRPRIRKRLIALRAVAVGTAVAAAAETAGAHPVVVAGWLRKIRPSDLAPLLDTRRVPPPLTPEQAAAARTDLEEALAQPLAARVRRRFAAFRLALDGHVEEAAAQAGVARRTVQKWLRRIRHHGMKRLLQPYIRPANTFAADPRALRALAGKEKNAALRKRITALASIADGMPVDDAAIAAGLTPTTVYKAMKAFQREGARSFRPQIYHGRAVRLSSAQLSALRAILRENPGISLAALRARILDEFGIAYSEPGLRTLLRRQLGVALRAPRRLGTRRHPAVLNKSPRSVLNR